ncbi:MULTISPECIES: serine hydrolase [unclassified Streptomyces]|uniref:serine hydrolase domain-containing protein n=1 Tax=unclassified Streptomyces TaxID=2593676 RepID=UPI00278BC90D|nr:MULTISPECIES: serine hydrolase domain-containing protein [unclassified Streptomyces]
MVKDKRALGCALALVVAVGGVVTTAGPAAAAATGSAARPSDADHGRGRGHDARLQAILGRLTSVDGAPGALLDARDRRGGATLTSGVGDVRSRAEVRPDSRFRIGSMTKMFTATVVLQLVAERRVELDAPVERYLPGVVRGHGNDGRGITVRQLLQHTSGLPDFLDHLKPQDVLKDPLAHHDARELVDIALAHPPTFEPGTGWSYSNTGYVLAGMLVEDVTGRDYADEVRRRVIGPLGLRGTSVPGDSPAIPGPHTRGYANPGGDGELIDVTRVNPTIGGAAGGVISTGRDLNRFLGALLGGRLLPPAQLKAMMSPRPTGSADGRAYGLGLERTQLPCGGNYWGHTGDFLGFETASGATLDGRRASVMVNSGPGGSQAQSDDIKSAVETALCHGGRP